MHILYQLSKEKVQVEELRQKLSCMEVKMHAVSTLLGLSVQIWFVLIPYTDCLSEFLSLMISLILLVHNNTSQFICISYLDVCAG